MSMLLCLGMFSACSNNDEMNVNGDVDLTLLPEDGTILTPIEEKDIEGYEAISIFFSAEMPIGSRSNSFFVDSNLDECAVINNLQELRNVYRGNQEIPNIDFGRYTLVLGQMVEPDAYYPVLRKNLEFRDNKCQQNLYIPKLEGEYTIAQPLYYWALYSKFRTEGISTKIVKDGGLRSVKEFIGELRYDNNNDIWHIVYAEEGRYEHDEYFIMNPMDLPEECAIYKKITFSGEFFEMSDESLESLQILRLGGQHYNYIYLSEMEIMEDRIIPYRGNPPFTITDMPGMIVEYRDVWCISYVENNTMVNLYIPTELSEEFKVHGLNVIISGNVYEEITDHPNTPYQKQYKIELTKIEKAE